MQANIKNALMTTAIVLGTIFVLRKIPVVRELVAKSWA